MRRFVLVSEKNWHLDLFKSLQNKKNQERIHISKQADLTYDKLIDIRPEKIFIPHWSYIIEEKIYSNFECIVFHMTDLPFGRGGSPLQNLIIRGIK